MNIPETTTDFQVGVSDTTILLVCTTGFVLLATTIYTLVLRRLKTGQELQLELDHPDKSYEERLVDADVATLNRAQRRARAKQIMKQQRRIAPLPGAAEQEQPAVPPHNEPIPPPAADHATNDTLRNLSSSRKQRQQMAKAVEKEERRLLDEKRQKAQAEAERIARLEKLQRDQQLAEKAKEERRLRQEQKEKEEQLAQERYNTFLSSPDGNVSISVTEWLQELQENRVVSTTEMAERFQVPTEAVTTRIQELIDSLRVTGALEEKEGRFIYVSSEELRELAQYIMSNNETTWQQVAKQLQTIIYR